MDNDRLYERIEGFEGGDISLSVPEGASYAWVSGGDGAEGVAIKLNVEQLFALAEALQRAAKLIAHEQEVRS